MDRIDQLAQERKEAREREITERKRKEEEELAEKKRKEEEKREAARRAKEEKKRAADEARRLVEQKKLDEYKTAVQQDEYALRLEASKRRMEELTKQIQSEQRVTPSVPPNWAEQHLQALARGEDPAKLGLPRPAPVTSAPIVKTPQQEANERKLYGLAGLPYPAETATLPAPSAPGGSLLPANGPTAQTSPANAPPVGNSPVLLPFDPKVLSPYQPEQRTIQAVAAPPALSAPSTFAPSAPNRAPLPPASVDKPMTREIAAKVTPYTELAGRAYNADPLASTAGSNASQYSYLGNAQTMLSSGLSGTDRMAISEKLSDSGFSAYVYRNDATKELVITFRGTECRDKWANDCSNATRWKPNDAIANVQARTGIVGEQYKLGSLLTQRVLELKQRNPALRDYEVVLTGHSLGGGIANYAGAENGGLRTITFNPARTGIQMSENPNAINIYAIGDLVGDTDAYQPLESSMAGAGRPPGSSYFVNSSTPSEPHSLDGVRGGLSEFTR